MVAVYLFGRRLHVNQPSDQLPVRRFTRVGDEGQRDFLPMSNKRTLEWQTPFTYGKRFDPEDFSDRYINTN